MRFSVIFIFLIFSAIRIDAQTIDTLKQSSKSDTTILNGSFLSEVDISGSDSIFKLKYQRYLGIVLFVYPYVSTAIKILERYDQEIAAIESRKEQKRYRSDEMDKLREDFSRGIKIMSHTQGDVLVKLLYRETGMTAFEIIDKHMGYGKALMWQTISLAGGANLRQTYNPVSGDDHIIEIIVKEIYAGKYWIPATPYVPLSKKEKRRLLKEAEKRKAEYQKASQKKGS